MNKKRLITSASATITYILLLACCVIFMPVLQAAEQQARKGDSVIDLKLDADYSDSGADTCLRCHDEDSDVPVTKIFMTAHGNQNDPRSPMAQFQCEACHGPAGEHSNRRVRKGQEREAMLDFDKRNMPVSEMNQICSSCHDSTEQHWLGSLHEQSNVACTDCHIIHQPEGIVQAKHNQVKVCGTCHQEQRLATKRFSRHPLEYQGQMGCTDCHNPHGSTSDHMLVRDTVNNTCFQCHAEKRGPFVWEHEPASDNCANCHASHGSNQPALLTQRAPFLCQSCHSAEGHPAIGYDRPGVSPLSQTMMLGRSCSNCHTQVHGSNHPAGNLLQR